MSTGFVLLAPDVGWLSHPLKVVLENALNSFFLGYSLPDEVYDDKWYYTEIREIFFNEEGLPNTELCDTEQEYWNYCRDPSVGLREVSLRVSSVLESIIELNDRPINDLYDRRVFTYPFNVLFYKNAITLIFRD